MWAGYRAARVGQTLDADEATRRLKANAVLHAIPVIAVTSYASSSDARAAGCFLRPLQSRALGA